MWIGEETDKIKDEIMKIKNLIGKRIIIREEAKRVERIDMKVEGGKIRIIK